MKGNLAIFPQQFCWKLILEAVMVNWTRVGFCVESKKTAIQKNITLQILEKKSLCRTETTSEKSVTWEYQVITGFASKENHIKKLVSRFWKVNWICRLLLSDLLNLLTRLQLKTIEN